jgi:glycosyltransferase involved in cell wall biosynthesis
VDAEVIFPPTVVRSTGDQERVGPFDGGFHLLVSRLLPYKNVDKAVAAFAGLRDERLLIIGQGPDEQRLRAAMPANVALVGGVSDAELRWAYASCTALLAPSIEDFGLTPLEAGAFGKPTLALRRGGYLDTVAEGITGLFLERPEAADIVDAVHRERAIEWDPEAIEKHAQQFGEEQFRDAIVAEVDAQLASAT